MKPKVLLLICILISTLQAASQRPAIDLTFTAINNAAWVKLDSIQIINRTQLNGTMITWPDTIISLDIAPGDWLLMIGYTNDYLSIVENDHELNEFHLFQNYPNPMNDHGKISLYVPAKGKVNITVVDQYGRTVISYEWQLDRGTHLFRYTPCGDGYYILTARWKDEVRSIKMLTSGSNNNSCTLKYIGNNKSESSIKVSPVRQGFIQESGFLDSPETNQLYVFQFATNIPCPGMATVEYEGQVYHTIQIFSQCWLKENLNVGTLIEETIQPANNGTIEKYCINNEPDSCLKYGGLYNWNEMMQYVTQEGSQGICPQGWHLPTDNEWKVLEGASDSQIGIWDSEWEINHYYRGFDSGKNLKSTSGWFENGNGTDLFGFSGLPAGTYDSGIFYGVSQDGYWWTSTELYAGSSYLRNIFYPYPKIGRDLGSKGTSYSVRCLRDL